MRLPKYFCVLTLAASMFAGHSFAANVEDYAKLNDFGNARLSPDGKYIAVERYDEISSTLIILDAETQKPLTELTLPPHQSIHNAEWANNDTLIFARSQRFGGEEVKKTFGEIIAISADGKRKKYLYGMIGDSSSSAIQKDKGFAKLINTLEHDDKNIIILATDWDKSGLLNTKPSIIKVDIYTGRRDRIAVSPISNPWVTFDLSGNLRFVSGSDENYMPVTYRYIETAKEWQKIEGIQPLGSFFPVQFLPGDKDFLAEISEAGEANCLYLVKQDNSREKLHCEAGVNIGGSMPSSVNGVPLAILSNATNPNVVMLSGDSEDSRLYESISKSFPGEIVVFKDFSSNGERILFSVSSDKKPSRYYLYDRKSNTSRLVFNSKASLDDSMSGTTTGFNFKARDGLTIHGLLTLPSNHVKGKTPMVVMPHGGPLGISDSWYFHNDVQWLVANGYAVLRVNFRGSGGYGENFMRKGYGTWGKEIQYDIIDATNFVADTQTIDKNRICITGGSFGAYSALMSSILAPQIFRCAIGYAGVYDLSMMFKKGDIPATNSGVRYLDLVLGKDQAELAAQSPAARAGELKTPVLLIHGSDDGRTPLPQAQRLEKALRDAGNQPEMLVVPNEGHGFVRTKNRVLYLNALKAFLDKHIGPAKTATK